MKPRTILAIGAMLAIASFIILAMIGHQRQPPVEAEKRNESPQVSATMAVTPLEAPTLASAPVEPSLPAEHTPQVAVKNAVKTDTKPPPTLAQSATNWGAKDPPPQDPTARIALSFVGAEPDAEMYWLGAINDPSLPAEERQNLIEDLNEDGLSDPKHPGLDDLPLIWNRLVLIEQLAPYAMDQVNADAFMEAYKDLVNLANLSVGAGEPVK